MTKYNKIYIPSEGGQSVVRYTIHNGYNATPVGNVDAKGNVIVLTIEELRECFNWGMSTLEDMKTQYMSFEDFLRHKGVQL